MKVKLSELYCKILIRNKDVQVTNVNGTVCYCCTSNGPRKHVLCKLVDSPHYKFLQGNREVYQQYLEKGGRLVGYGLEHSVSTYDNLIQTFDLAKLKCLPCHDINGKIVLQDGVHRCCIILFNDLLEEIPISIKSRKQ